MDLASIGDLIGFLENHCADVRRAVESAAAYGGAEFLLRHAGPALENHRLPSDAARYEALG